MQTVLGYYVRWHRTLINITCEATVQKILVQLDINLDVMIYKKLEIGQCVSIQQC